jgi:hypothetical protein
MNEGRSSIYLYDYLSDDKSFLKQFEKAIASQNSNFSELQEGFGNIRTLS